jgi:predicted nucleic acid-binding protein
VKIVVDANIVFSGILNTNGKIGDLLINSGDRFDFIAPEFLVAEIEKHYSKLVAISGLSLRDVREAQFRICKEIVFISAEQIYTKHWLNAEKLVADIDPGDIQYLAYSRHFKCKLWTGDKKLYKGLSRKGVKNIITTDELFRLRESRSTRK